MSSSNFGNIQYKASNGQINLDEAQGIVECFVAGIGNKDSVGDICATGAFAKSLQRRKPRVVWGHNWNDPIGKVLEIYEVPVNDPRLPMKMKMAGIGGLYAKVQFNLQSEKGREAFANVAFFGEEQEWSIGYKTLRSQFDQNLQANVLYEVELYEVSPVLHGANQLTGTISVKSDEEKMHGMMPLVIGAPTAGKPSADGIFDEGIAQRISGPQLAGVVAELSRRAGGPVMVVEATENSVIFVKPGKGKFRIGYHFTGSEYMFGKPELLEADQPKPAMQSGPAPMPGISAKPTGENKPQVVNPAMPMPVAMKPENGGMVIVPLPPVKYEGGEGKEKPELVAEERELAESLVRIAGKYGKFDEDGDGIWAGYYPPAENKVKDIGVKCANCVLYQGNGKCKILSLNVEPEGKCRFAIIPDGVVVGFGKKEYNDILDEDEVKMVEDIEAKYPGEFILGAFRNVVKKRRKKRKEYKTLEEWGIEEQELAEKGLDPFLAHNASYVIPVNPEDAFTVKSILDPVFEYHRIDTHVNEFGIVINSPLDQESKDAIQTATSSAYGFLKKKLETEGIEEKALGRRLGRAIASRGIDRPNLGGRRGRRSRGSGINPPPGWDPRTVEDANLNSMVGDGTPWEQPDPTPFGPGSVNSPKPSKRQMRQRAELADTEKLSSGKRNERRHADRSADMEAKFPNPDEMAKRKLQEDIAEQWMSQGLGWEEVPRYNADKGKSSDYLRGRELGVNQSRLMWQGDDVRKRPARFDEKKKASTDYADWYMDYANAVSSYIDANAKEGDDNWAGIEEALKTQVYEKRPDTSSWTREDVDAMNQTLDNLGLNPQRGVRSSLKDREPAPLSSGKRGRKARTPKGMPSDKEIYDRRMTGETLQEVADDLGVERIDIRKAEQRHMAKLREGGKPLSSGRKINSYEDLVDESQKLDAMDRNSPEFESRANELLKEASRLQKYLASLERGEGGDEDFEDSDVFDDIEEIKDDIRFFKKGGTRGFSSGREVRGYRGGEPINLPTEMLDWDDLTGAEKRQYLNEFDDIEDDEERLRTAEEEWNSRSFGMRQQMTEDMLKEIDELEAEAKKFEDTERRLSDFEGRHFAYIEEIIKNPMMADIFDYADARERLDGIRKRISDARDGETGGLSSGKTARRDLVSGNKVPGEGKFARLIDRQMGNRNDEREPSYVARKYADALVENWRSLSDSERKEFLQDEMGSEYMPKAEEFLEILDEAWATYSQRNKKFKDIDNELQDVMDSSRLSSGRKNKFSRDLADFEVERVADELDNMSEADRKEYEDYAAEYLTGKGMSPDDPDWDSELQGRIEESVADNINEQLDMADRAGRLGEPSPTTRADTRGFPQSTGFQSGRIDDWEVDFLKERLSKLKAGSEDTDILYRINQRGGIEEGRAGEAFELLKQLQSELNDLSARAFDDSQPKRRSLFNFNIYDVTEDEDVTDILFGYDTAIDDIKSAIEEHSKRLETIDNEIALIDEQLDTTTGESTRFSRESIDSELTNIEKLYEDDDEEYIKKQKLSYIGELAQELIDLDQQYQDATDLDSRLNQNNRLRDVSYGKYDDIDAAIDELLDNHKTYVENLTDSKSWNENQKRNLKDSGVPSIDELDAATKFIKRPDAPLEIDAEGVAADAGRDTERGFSSGRVGDKLGGWQKTDDGFEADAPGIDGLYSIGKGEDGKFYVTRTYDAVREGGQYQMDTEHDFGFSDVNSAKRWAESDYGKATMAWNYDQVYDDQMGSEIGFSSGRVRTAASIYNINPAVNPEMQGMLANRDLVDDAGTTLASGRTRGQRAASRLPKVNATDKEIFERRMEGASLEDVANELGVPRQVVRQAEVRHMARMRGTLDSPIDSSYVQDYKDAESFARDMEESAALEAAQERADELFHDRIQAGESPSAIAKEYGLRPGQVIEGAERHKQMLRERDIAAEKWLAENPEFASGRKGRSFKNPMEGMFAGERLSSGKQDEVYRAVQDRLIKMLEGADPNSWEFPWHKSGFVPTNPSNKNRPYTNINALMLMFAQQDMGYKTPMWAGFEQWKKLGGSVRKGEKGTQIFIPTIVPPKKDKDGNVVKEGFVFFKVGYVFNADQIDGVDIDALKGEQLDPAERLQELEDALAEVGAIVKTGTDGRAYYRPSTDEISMPPFESFKSREGYYATLAHEMMHWTGHTSRLNRPNMNQFGNEAYAREELVAEIASAFFLAALGVSAEPREDHAKYLANWLQALKNDPNALQEAFKEAQKAADFVIGKSPKMQKKLGKAAAEKGALPGNKDLVPSMPEVSQAFSSGKLAPDGRPYGDRFLRTPDGKISNLAIELGMPDEGILSEFTGFHYPYGHGPGMPAEPGYQFFRRDSEYLGMFGQWSAVKGDDGKWQLTSWVFDNYPSGEDEGDTDGIDRDYGGIAETFDTPEEMAAFIESYEDERQAFRKQYDKLADDLYSAQAGLNRNDADEARILESIQKLINQEMERRKYEEDEAKRLRLERDERQQQEEMMWTWKEIESQFDAETANWSAEDWREHADDLRADIDNENARGGFSSGRVSRYNDTDPATIPSIKGAAGRDDEIGSNTRAIIKNTYVPTDLYDLNDVRANGTPIRFKYKGKDRTIYPTGIKAKKEGGIYFIGVDEDSGQYRSFNLEKIDGLIDGATLPINPRQPGVAKGDGKQVYVERFSSGRNEAKAAVSRMLNDIDPRVWENDDWKYEEELDRMAKSFAESYYVEDNDAVDDVFYELQLLQDALAQDGTAESDRKADFLLRVLDNFETNDYENRRERSDGQPSDSDIFEEQEDWGLYSGRKKRPASSKRRPMSDEEMQAYRDGLRLRAKTIPKKRRGGPEASEFSSGRLSSGTTDSGRKVALLLNETNTKDIEDMARAQKRPIRIGNIRENDTRGPLDVWQVPVEPLINLLGKKRDVSDAGNPLVDVTPEDLVKLLKISPADAKKLVTPDGKLVPGASIPEEIAYDMVRMIVRPYSGGGKLGAATAFEKELEKYNIDGFMQQIFGWNAKPYWYDEFENPIESEREFKELMDDGAYIFGLLSPIDVEIPDAPAKINDVDAPSAPRRDVLDKRGLATEVSKADFTIQQLGDFLGVEPGNRKAMIEKIEEITDGRISVTSTTVGSWKTDGVPLAWADVFKELGIIESAEEIWGEAGRNYDASMRKAEFHKRLDTVLKGLGAKITDSKLSSILGATNFRKEANKDLPKLSIEAMISVGQPPRYSEFDMARSLDTINEELNTNITLDDIRNASFASGRRAQRRVEQAGRESVESLSSGRKNNGAPDNITPRMQNELMDWARKNTWSSFAQSLLKQFEKDGFLSEAQWRKLLTFVDTQKMKR